MKRIVGFAILLLLLSFSIGLTQEKKELSPNQSSPKEMADILGVKLPKLPWHLADIWLQFESKTEHFEKLDIEVIVDRDIPDTFNLYIAPVGIAQINGLEFYGGLQSNINGWATKESRTRVHPGKGAIFSRWSSDKTKPIGLNHTRMMEGGLCESAGYEGEFCSIRKPYAWTSGTYTYSIRKTDKAVIGGKPNTWFGCFVKSHRDNKEVEIGSLRFEGDDFTFWDRHAAFVEVYSTEKIPQPNIPKCNVTFGYPRINGGFPKLKSTAAVYNLKGRAAAPQCAKAKIDGEKVLIEVGEIFSRNISQESIKLQIPD